MEIIILAVPGCYVIVPRIERDQRGVLFRVDLAAVHEEIGDFTAAVAEQHVLYPKATLGPTISAGRRLIRVVDGYLYASLAECREGHAPAADGVGLAPAPGSWVKAPGGLLAVAPGAALALVAGPQVTRAVIEMEDGGPMQTAPAEMLRFPMAAPPELPPPTLLHRQALSMMAPKVAPPEPQAPGTTRAGDWVKTWSRND